MKVSETEAFLVKTKALLFLVSEISDCLLQLAGQLFLQALAYGGGGGGHCAMPPLRLQKQKNV